jgi:hypothetical protein
MAPQPHRDISLVNVLPQHAFAGDARLSGASAVFWSFLGKMELHQPLDFFRENYFSLWKTWRRGPELAVYRSDYSFFIRGFER